MASEKAGQVLIVNDLGLHARAASKFAQVASQFTCDVYLTKDTLEINGKSIMGILMLVAAKGTKLQLRTAGADAVDAFDTLAALIADGFGEIYE